MAQSQSTSGATGLDELMKALGIGWADKVRRNRDLMDKGIEFELPPTRPGTPLVDPQGLGRPVVVSDLLSSPWGTV